MTALRAADLATELGDYARVETVPRRPIDLSQLVRNARAHVDAIAGPRRSGSPISSSGPDRRYSEARSTCARCCSAS
jgi:hypothetical protein